MFEHRKKNRLLVLFWFFAILLLVTFLGSLLNDYFFVNSKNILNDSDRTWLQKFFAVCIIAPVSETFLFQYLIIKSLRLIKFKRFYFTNTAIIVTSGFIFSFAHNSNIIVTFFGIIIGMLFSFSYMYIEKKIDLNPFWSVCGLHSAVNLFGLIFYG